MKKFVFVLGLFLAFYTNAWAQDINQNQPEQKRSDISYRKCENLLMPTKVADKPLLSLFADIKIAELTNNCFMQKIKEISTPKQFEYYEITYRSLTVIFNAILYYKGKLFEQKIAVEELLYRFQSYFYSELTGNKDFSIPNQYSLDNSLHHRIIYKNIERLLMELSNLETRRNVRRAWFLAENGMGNFFYYSGYSGKEHFNALIDKKTEFMKTMYQLLMLLKHNKYFMDPNNSVQFFNDCSEWEIMTGENVSGWGTNNLSCPIPFP